MAKRDDIVDAALTIVCDEGIRALTLPLLFKTAHTGAGTFYHYFNGREELIDAVFDTCCSVTKDALPGIAEGDYDPEAAFMELCSGIILAHLDYPRELSFLYLYAYDYVEHEEDRMRVTPSLMMLTQVIMKAQDRDLISDDVDPAMMARLVRGVVASTFWCHQRGLCSIDAKLAEEVARRTWKAML